MSSSFEASMLQGVLVLAVLLCTISYVAATALAVSHGILPNGNFEHGLNHWTISGRVDYIKRGENKGQDVLVIPEGNYAVKLGNGASISQKANVTKETDYSITFSVAPTCAKYQQLIVQAAPNSGTGVLNVQTRYDSVGWEAYSWAFKAKTEVVDIIFQNPDSGEDPSCGPILDSVAIKVLNVNQADKKNILINGNFEEGPFVYPNKSLGVLIPANITIDHSPLPGWTSKSNKAVKYIDSKHFSVPEGKYAIELVAGRESVLGQVAKTIPGKKYALSLKVGDKRNSCVGHLGVNASVGKKTIQVTYTSEGEGGDNSTSVVIFTANSAETEIQLSSDFNSRTDDGSLCGMVIDDVKLVEYGEGGDNSTYVCIVSGR